MHPLLECCEGWHDWMIETIHALVLLESPTTDKAAVDRCGDALARRLEAIGGRVTPFARADAGDHLRAEFGRGAGQVLLLGHLDTVWPVGQLARMPLVRVGDRLHGPGVFDMKAGIVIGMTAVRALLETGRHPDLRLVMLLTSDEETGSSASRALIEEEARGSRAVLVLEPALPGGAVKTMRKGCGTFEILVRGVEAHAGIDPGRGASAIHELAHQIRSLESLEDARRGVSVNVGTVTGGSRSNVIAGEARATVDVRVARAEDAPRLEAAVRGLRPSLPGTSIEVAGAIDRPPLVRTPGVARLFELAAEAAADLGLGPLGEGATGGGSDGNFTAALGVPTLDGLGATGDGAHALHEHVLVGALPGRAALVAALIARIAAGPLG